MIAPKKVGVTGATGQVGSRLLRHLQAAGIPAVAVVRNALGAALCSAAASGCEIRIGSLTPPAGEPHVLDDCDVIVNCALEGSGGIPRQAYTRNRALVDGLLKARSLKWLVHLSTVAVYGELITAARDPEHERLHPHPTSEYGRSKLDVEQYAAEQARRRGLECTSVPATCTAPASRDRARSSNSRAIRSSVCRLTAGCRRTRFTWTAWGPPSPRCSAAVLPAASSVLRSRITHGATSSTGIARRSA
jgi:nucleoside-diphosphate-sugar epimerase